MFPSKSKAAKAAAALPSAQSSLLKPGDTLKFEEIWPKIEPLVRLMFTEKGISKSQWQDIFWHVHNLCLWNINMAVALQEKLVEIFTAYINEEQEFIFKEVGNDNVATFLRAYVDAWKRFLFYYKYVPLPFNPLEKFYTSNAASPYAGTTAFNGSKKKKLLENEVESCIRLTMIELWVVKIFSEINGRLIEGAMTLIDSERSSGGNFNKNSISNITSSSSSLTTSSIFAPTRVPVDPYLIIGVKESCLYLGHYLHDRLFLYRVNYERVYIARTEAYYLVAGAAYLEENGILAYMKWVDGRLKEEQERATTRGYLEGHSLSKILNALVNTLIVSVQELLIEQFSTLLTSGDISMLSLLFNLLARVPPSTEASNSKDISGLVDTFREHLISRGLKELKVMELGCRSGGENQVKSLSNLVADSEAYIEQLLRLFTDATNLVGDAFNGDPRFLTARDMAFNKLINEKSSVNLASGGAKFEAKNCHQTEAFSNNNIILENKESSDKTSQQAKTATCGESRCAELFANYCDMLLRRGTALSRGLTSEEIEAKLANVILVLKYVQDRLLFMRLYKAHLTRRLLLDTSSDVDREEVMVGRLREVGMPADALNSLARMFADLKVSEDFSRAFRESQQCLNAEKSSQIVSIKVLNSKAWSTTGSSEVGSQGIASVSLPLGVEETLLKVEAFYKAKHTGRSLLWHHQFSSAVITFHTEQGCVYDLEATAYQVAVLLCWNDRPQNENSEERFSTTSPTPTFTLEALSLATQLPAVELKRTLLSLVSNPKLKSQLLLPINSGKSQPHLRFIRDITPSTEFKLNDKFALLSKAGRLLKRARVNLVGRLALGSLGGSLAVGSFPGSGEAWTSATEEAEAEKEAIARLRAERAEEALLKILKTRKSAYVEGLFTEATGLLSRAFFVPTKALLAERLNWLLEHGSVRRDEKVETLYYYV